jgi:hypothetical protein
VEGDEVRRGPRLFVAYCVQNTNTHTHTHTHTCSVYTHMVCDMFMYTRILQNITVVGSLLELGKVTVLVEG